MAPVRSHGHHPNLLAPLAHLLPPPPSTHPDGWDPGGRHTYPVLPHCLIPMALGAGQLGDSEDSSSVPMGPSVGTLVPCPAGCPLAPSERQALSGTSATCVPSSLSALEPHVSGRRGPGPSPASALHLVTGPKLPRLCPVCTGLTLSCHAHAAASWCEGWISPRPSSALTRWSGDAGSCCSSSGLCWSLRPNNT